MWLGKAINSAQWFWSNDGESTYSHSGIILDDTGLTFESLWSIRKSNLDSYEDVKILIGRDVTMTQERFYECWSRVLKHEGQWYPGWRLFLHLIPPLSKLSITGIPVCSELAWKFIDGKNYMGVNPDTVADRIKQWDRFNVIYEDVWSKSLLT
jgi:hypothetical protein